MFHLVIFALIFKISHYLISQIIQWHHNNYKNRICATCKKKKMFWKCHIRRNSVTNSAVNVMSFILLSSVHFSVSLDLFPRGFSPPPRGSKENQHADLIRRRSGIRSQQWESTASLLSLSFSSFLSLFLSLFQLFPWRTSLFAISPILSYRRNRTHIHVRTLFLSLRRFILSRKPDHAPWILFASSLVLRSYSRSKLRLPTALEVSRKSRRELYLSFAQHRERESKEEHVSRFPAGARYSGCLTPRSAIVKQSERRQIPRSRCIFHFIWWFIYRLRGCTLR